MSQEEIVAESFRKAIDSYSPEQLVRGMLDLVIMKTDFENQELYLAIFRKMAHKLVIKLGA